MKFFLFKFKILFFISLLFRKNKKYIFLRNINYNLVKF